MPIYEYICHACGEEFEAIQKFSDPHLKNCECGQKGTVERKLSLSAFHLQGGGWYKDEYGGSNGKASSTSGNGDGDGAKAKSGDNDSKSTESTGSPAKEESKSSTSKSESKSSDSKSEGKSKPAGGSGAAPAST